MLFAAIEHQLHWHIRQLGELAADDALPIGCELAAEAAAHVLRDDTHVALRNAERLRKSLRALMTALRRDPRREPVAFPFAHRAVRFEADVADDVRRVGLFNGVRRA